VLKPYGTKEARIYDGVGALANTAFFWTSGQRGAGQPPNFGNMKTQAHAGLQNLKNDLAAAGLTFKDVVFLRAFVGPDKPGAPDARYDLANWNAAYDEFFNNPENPHKPARTTVTVPNFGGAGPLIEIEIVAAFPGNSNAVTFSGKVPPRSLRMRSVHRSLQASRPIARLQCISRPPPDRRPALRQISKRRRFPHSNHSASV
jgi:enamine deaminase RidA (YjgF/YER057c/UK114 family)